MSDLQGTSREKMDLLSNYIRGRIPRTTAGQNPAPVWMVEIE